MKWLAVVAAGLAAAFASAPVASWAQGAPPPLPQASPAPTYYYNDNGKPSGPFTLDEIKAKIASGAITPDTLIWAPGMPGWVPVKQALAGPQPGPGPQPTPQPALSATGCTGRHVIMADDFSNAQSWQGDTTSEGSKLKYKPKAGQWSWTIYRRALTGNADICVTVQVPHRFEDATWTYAGVVLAAQDSNNFYAFLVSPTGNASLQRYKNGEFVEPAIQWRAFDAVKSDPGTKNQLRVSIVGNVFTLFVNGEKFDSFTPEAPMGGKIGIIAASEKAREDAWKFAGLKVTSDQ
jgi:hypothetical protein